MSMIVMQMELLIVRIWSGCSMIWYRGKYISEIGFCSGIIDPIGTFFLVKKYFVVFA
jgi:hypothetical protein